jgi:hypothetical protein
LLDALRAYPNMQTGFEPGHPSVADASAAAMPVIPIGFVRNGHVMKYFSMVASVGTPQTIAAQELRLECMFPADDETEARHLEMLDAAPQSQR